MERIGNAALCCFVGNVLWCSATAQGYELPCHEKITSQALRMVRMERDAAAPLNTNSNERALIDDVEFEPDPDMRDLGAISLLLGVNDNDLKGHSRLDLSELASVHGDPNQQDEHCLRAPEHDEPNGSRDAVASCRGFIRKRIDEAIAGLGSDGKPDSNQRTSLPVRLALRGEIGVDLPTFYVRMGQALHALQDSFAHTYRTVDGRNVTTVLNWVDFVKDDWLESRDGPLHARGLDSCEEIDAPRMQRYAWATEATIALLRPTLDRTLSLEQKRAAVEAVLDQYLGYQPGCSAANQWCDALERKYKDDDTNVLGCSLTGGRARPLRAKGLVAMLLTSLAILAAGGWTVRARRRRALTAASLIMFLCTGVARSEEPSQGNPEPQVFDPKGEQAPPPPPTKPVEEPGPKNPSHGAWGLYFGASGSVDKPAFAGALGVRRHVSKHWTFGWDVEWNPWVSVTAPSAIRPGVLNTYGSAIIRLPLAYQSFNLRTTLSAGLSYLLFDLYGASQGALGMYLGVSPLGLEWKLSRLFYLIINPLNIAVPIPQVRGVPLSYPQYRFSIGFELLGS